MLATNHRKPRLSFSPRGPWRRRPRALAPYVGGTGILYTYRDLGGAAWWSDGAHWFRGTVPDYLRRAYLEAGLAVDTPASRMPLSPMQALALLGPRLAHPVACYQVSVDHGGPHGLIPVAVFATGNRKCPELHVDDRCVAHVLSQFDGCSFWPVADLGVAVRDRQAFQIVALILARPAPPPGLHRRGGAP